MSVYYNRGKGSISITLLDGKPHFFPPKKNTKIESHLDSSPMLLRYIKKGFLHRIAIVPQKENKEINLSFSKETGINEPTENKLESMISDILPPIEEKEVVEGLIEEGNTKRRKKVKE